MTGSVDGVCPRGTNWRNITIYSRISSDTVVLTITRSIPIISIPSDIHIRKSIGGVIGWFSGLCAGYGFRIGDTGIVIFCMIGSVTALYRRSYIFIGIYEYSIITGDIRERVLECPVVFGYDR